LQRFCYYGFYVTICHLPCSLKIFLHVFASLYVKENSKEVCEEISFPSLFRKMLMSTFLLRFKANYLEKMPGYPQFSLWIPIALTKIYFFPRGPNLAQKPLYLVGTVLNVTESVRSTSNYVCFAKTSDNRNHF